MKSEGIYEARTRFSELIDEVEEGNSIVITRHGSPVARIVPEQSENVDFAKLFQDWVEFRRRESIALGGLTVNELIDEGHD